MANNCDEAVIVANLDLGKATGTYAERGAKRPPFLAPHWKAMVEEVRRRAKEVALDYDLPG